MKIADYIVIGSGCTGAMAAQTLVESGAQVTMLDVGVEEEKSYGELIPDKDFLDIRRTESGQYKYLIGENFEGVVWGNVGKGEQITPPRKHIIKDVDKLTPVDSATFSPFESLGYGGSGIGWGIGCWEFSKPELAAVGLDNDEMEAAYQIVGDRIGISAAADSAKDYTIRNLNNYQPSPTMDGNHQEIYEKYNRQTDYFKKTGFVMGRAPLALLIRDKDGRQGYKYRDMDFYSDKDQSAYRPWITINKLRQAENFVYIGRQLALRFVENKDFVTVECLDLNTNKKQSFHCKKLVLSAGVLGTARIVLRSFNESNVSLPLLCNPYSYIPCLQLSKIGAAAEPGKLGFAQLSLFLDEKNNNFGASMASLYSYQSLMLFRMVRQVPLGFGSARQLLQYLTSGIIIMGIHQPDEPTENKYVTLVPNENNLSGDVLQIHYALSDDEQKARVRREKKYVKAMRKLGVYALKRIDPGHGASIHYAGTLPYDDADKPYTLTADGRLHGTANIYVADGSGFKYLPAKGLTFTLMANAHRTALEMLKND